MDATDAMVMGLTSFKVALVFHIAGALLLFAAVGLQVLVVTLLRFAGSVNQIRVAGKIVRKLPIIFGLASALVLLSGLYLTYLDWHYGERIGWIMVALVMFLLAGIYGAVSGRRLARALTRELSTADGRITESLNKLRQSPKRIADSGISAASILGILVIMIFQPSVAVSIVILIIALACALIFTLIPLSANTT